jgi:hypothetical protein
VSNPTPCVKHADGRMLYYYYYYYYYSY